ncbi:uncharacterized protein CTRU02_205839 [Colletotrichum truncatum]|uniref:Uncharacterized protein n=1 Tax=Colletotrichum truncatum TaxID=5467 RepID=A0ACC3Z562_COLTU|nr:uncharacterized protein CTRU02_04668 [Colletotrichum truncatum]KAF6795105.1 hypothetical protein CTRU02_04668 [Colletotrichum truncatum]
MVANKDLVNNNTYFLDPHRPRTRPDQFTPHDSAGLGASGNDEEPQDSHFGDEMWVWDRLQSPSSSANSFNDYLSSEMALDFPHSEGSRTTADDLSINTPSPAEELLVDNSRPPPLVDTDKFGSDLAYPHYDKSQTLLRPKKLVIGNRVSKTRVVKDINKTNQVREAGACIRCRIKKTPCSAIHSCDSCKKDYPQFSKTPEVCCIHNDLAAVAKDNASGRFETLSSKEEIAVRESLRLGSPRFRETRFTGQVFFDQDISKLGIPAVLANYDCKAGNAPSGCTFERDSENPALKQDMLLQWAGQALSPVDGDTFEGVVESFIKTFIKSHVLSTFSSHAQIKTLLENVHTFKCMYKICRSRTLCFLQDGASQAQLLPFPAQVQIRGIARKALEAAERDILAELDKYIKTPKLENKERPAIWAVLWQLMLVYRDLLRNTKPCLNNAEPLFNAVAVFYAAFFRNTGALKFYEEGMKDIGRQYTNRQAELHKAFNDAVSRRDVFYQTIISGVHDIDQHLKGLVVSPEMKLLSRMAKKKTAAGKRAAANANDEDEVMED